MIEAMKLALEALCLTYKTVPTKHLDLGMLDEAIATLRTAIEQAERQEPVLWLVNGVVQVSEIPADYTGCLYTTPPAAQPAPVQKSVKSDYRDWDYQDDLEKVTPPAAPRQDECVVCGDKVRVIPRPWVGLTDDEIDKTHETQVWDARRSYARAIEAKLREKNT